MLLLQVVSIPIKLKVSIKNEDSRLNHLPKSNSLYQTTSASYDGLQVQPSTCDLLPTRGIQVVTLQVQEVQLQVVAIDLHMANLMWFRPFYGH